MRVLVIGLLAVLVGCAENPKPVSARPPARTQTPSSPPAQPVAQQPQPEQPGMAWPAPIPTVTVAPKPARVPPPPMVDRMTQAETEGQRGQQVDHGQVVVYVGMDWQHDQCYHRERCRTLWRGSQSCTLEWARGYGLRGCRVCKP